MYFLTSKPQGMASGAPRTFETYAALVKSYDLPHGTSQTSQYTAHAILQSIHAPVFGTEPRFNRYEVGYLESVRPYLILAQKTMERAIQGHCC